MPTSPSRSSPRRPRLPSVTATDSATSTALRGRCSNKIPLTIPIAIHTDPGPLRPLEQRPATPRPALAPGPRRLRRPTVPGDSPRLRRPHHHRPCPSRPTVPPSVGSTTTSPASATPVQGPSSATPSSPLVAAASRPGSRISFWPTFTWPDIYEEHARPLEPGGDPARRRPAPGRSPRRPAIFRGEPALAGRMAPLVGGRDGRDARSRPPGREFANSGSAWRRPTSASFTSISAVTGRTGSAGILGSGNWASGACISSGSTPRRRARRTSTSSRPTSGRGPTSRRVATSRWRRPATARFVRRSSPGPR